MNKRWIFLIILILATGIAYRLGRVDGGNFLFHMDSARDFIDVREMVELKKLRLVGPTSAIEGFYTGPLWYYLLAIPYVLSDGHPYSAILMEVIFWAVGGVFLLKLCSRFGTLAMLFAGYLWIASNYLVLITTYSFHPNLIALMTPLFIYFLEKYLKETKGIFLIICFLLSAIFFQLEMNFGVFAPLIILATLIFSKKYNSLKTYSFLLGLLIFILSLFPQIAFDARHQFIMSQSLIKHLQNPTSRVHLVTPTDRFPQIAQNFYDMALPTFLSSKLLIFFLILSLVLISHQARATLYPNLALITILSSFLAVPFIGYVFLPVNVNSWHIGAISAVYIIYSAILVGQLKKIEIFGHVLTLSLIIFLIFSLVINTKIFFNERGQKLSDQSAFVNEIEAIDYVYHEAGGKNFKVYAYLPSVYDYPYQYLFWWYGQKRYNYLPKDYSYLPQKPEYIRNKHLFSNNILAEDSDLVFLIKEPDHPQRRQLWENNFMHLQLIKVKMIGPLEIEVRKEAT